ncbi:hypothetical protein [Parasitella parasitica]|uniref:Uncharacterized protein n=1 Tax=Parasitella parasitica TaxID=35722 RepID=A0A0B7NK91_9FUNG|nr:hypothetical protein [Parasitella parasitica]
MFTRIINTIRESISKNPNSNKCSSANNNNNKLSSESEYSSSGSRRPSITEEFQNDNHSMLSKFSTSQPMPLGRNNSISEPIAIGTPATLVPGANEKRRRSSTLFGISNVTYDDYVQKDLISSSWS